MMMNKHLVGSAFIAAITVGCMASAPPEDDTTQSPEPLTGNCGGTHQYASGSGTATTTTILASCSSTDLPCIAHLQTLQFTCATPEGGEGACADATSSAMQQCSQNLGNGASGISCGCACPTRTAQVYGCSSIYSEDQPSSNLASGTDPTDARYWTVRCTQSCTASALGSAQVTCSGANECTDSGSEGGSESGSDGAGNDSGGGHNTGGGTGGSGDGGRDADAEGG